MELPLLQLEYILEPLIKICFSQPHHPHWSCSWRSIWCQSHEYPLVIGPIPTHRSSQIDEVLGAWNLPNFIMKSFFHLLRFKLSKIMVISHMIYTVTRSSLLWNFKVLASIQTVPKYSLTKQRRTHRDLNERRKIN